MITVRTANPIEDLPKLVGSQRSLSLAVAYVTPSGMECIKSGLESARQSRRSVRFLLALDGSTTHPDAVEYLFKLMNTDCQVKHFYDVGKQDRIFHPKLYISHSAKGNRITFLTGSYNLTKRALERNQEHGLWVDCQGKEQPGQDALNRFTKFWDAAVPLTQEVVERYKAVWDKNCPEIDEDELCSLTEPTTNVFRWPSEEAAFLMGAICARGRFNENERQIEISLQFNPNKGRAGKTRSHLKFTPRTRSEAPKRIQDNAQKLLASAQPIRVDRQKITIDFREGDKTFDTIFKAFRKDASGHGFPLPTYMTRLDKSGIKNFIQGYAVSTALINTQTKMTKQIDPVNPYAVWIRPLENYPYSQDMFLSIENMLSKLGVNGKAISSNPEKPYYAVAVEAREFSEKIQFGIRSWDQLVKRVATLNDKKA